MRAHAASPWVVFPAGPRFPPRIECLTDLCSGVVVSPEGSDLVLSSYVPHVELYVSVGDGLDVEADGRDRRDRLVQLELVQDR